MFLRKSGMLAVSAKVVTAFIAPTSPSSFCNRAADEIRLTSTSSSTRNTPQTARFPTTHILVSTRLATVPSSILNLCWAAPTAIAAGRRRQTRYFVDMMAREGRGGRGGRGGSGGRGRNSNRADRVGDSYAAQHRCNVSPGMPVEVLQKQHQRTGQLTAGVVSRLLTNSAYHPRGVKVMLSGGMVGRVQHIRGDDNEHLSAATTRSGLSPNVEGGFVNIDDTSCENSDHLAAESDGVLPSTIGTSGIASTATIGTGRRRLQRTLPATSTGRTTTTTTATATSPTVTSPTADRSDRMLRVESKTTKTSDSAGATRSSPGERAPAPAVATTAAAVSPVPPVLPHARRQLRAFRAERVQGRSWSLDEGGELVVTGEGGEELEGKGSTMVDYSDVFREGRKVSRRGRGKGGRGSR